jgi:lipoprotein NlpI
MRFISWFRSRLSTRYRAMSQYRLGMNNAQRHNHQGAIIDYTTVIEMADAPADIRAMALYNRALVYDAIDDQARAVADLGQVLTMSGTSEQVRTEARRKITRMDRTQSRSDTNQS